MARIDLGWEEGCSGPALMWPEEALVWVGLRPGTCETGGGLRGGSSGLGAQQVCQGPNRQGR